MFGLVLEEKCVPYMVGNMVNEVKIFLGKCKMLNNRRKIRECSIRIWKVHKNNNAFLKHATF